MDSNSTQYRPYEDPWSLNMVKALFTKVDALVRRVGGNFVYTGLNGSDAKFIFSQASNNVYFNLAMTSIK